MKTVIVSLCSLAFALTFTRTAAAADLGDPAAPLQIAEWVKGGPVDLAAGKGKQIYVVEFWATWCPPCRTSIPHLTELQKKFQDVVFVGISDEEVPVVKKFVTRMGDKMAYTVAVDKNSQTGKAYMEAYGIKGIPHAFIVDKAGRIIWNGHPMEGLAAALTDVVANKFDLAREKKRAAARSKLQDFYELAGSGAEDDELKAAATELEALDKAVGGIIPGEPFSADEALKQIKFQKAVGAYQRAVLRNKPEAELEPLAQKIQQVAPTNFNLAEFKETLLLNTTMRDYYKIVTGNGDTNQLAALTRQLSETRSKNGDMLNNFAWALLTSEEVKIRDVILATKLAKAAVSATGEKQVAELDTYARALFDSGQPAEAVVWQKKAVAIAGTDEQRQELTAALKKYEEAARTKPPSGKR
jgi:thiol-disulfide isomerase/thioredoxin